MSTKTAAGTALAAAMFALYACGGGAQETSATREGDSRREQAAARFAQCMRRNGVPDFPDPGPGGAFEITPETSRDAPRAAQERAHRRCASLLAAAGPPSAADRAVDAKAERRLLAFARCMRSRGVDIPDPRTPQGGGLAIPLPDDFDRDNPDPRYVRAEKACRPHIESLEGGAR